MIKSYPIQKAQSEKRLSSKTLDKLFIRLIEDGANCSPFESDAILSIVKRVYRLDQPSQDSALRPWQMKIIGVSAFEPSGKPLSICKMEECVITIYDSENDAEARTAHGTTGLRRAKLLRIASEAFEQNVLLTQEDLADHILHCGLRTLGRDIHYFKKLNIFVPTRGQIRDIGPGVSHKVAAIELLLQRKNEHEIAQLIYHNIKSIERYTENFIRVVRLLQKKFTIEEIACVQNISIRLTQEYANLYDKYNTMENQEIINSILNKPHMIDLERLNKETNDDNKKNLKEVRI